MSLNLGQYLFDRLKIIDPKAQIFAKGGALKDLKRVIVERREGNDFIARRKYRRHEDRAVPAGEEVSEVVMLATYVVQKKKSNPPMG